MTKEVALWTVTMTTRLLKWVTILAPVTFFLVFDYLRHFVFGAFLHSLLGFALIYIMILVGVVVFSEVIFRLIKKMQDKIVQQNRELTVVNDIAESLSLSLGIELILRNSLDRVMSLVGADAGAMCLLDAGREELFSETYTGFSGAMLERIRRQKLEDARIGSQVVKTGLPVIVPKTQEYGDARIAEMARRDGFLSLLSFPLTSQGKVVGVLVLASKREGAFQESSLRLVSGIANQVAIAVERASLFEESSRRAQDLAALNEISTLVSTSLELGEVMKAALDKVINLLSVEAGEVWLWEESTQEMVMALHAGAFPEAFREVTRFGKGEGFPGKVALTGEAVISLDIAQDERFVRNAVRKAGIHFFACVPLKAKGNVVGALDLATREYRELSPRELQLLTSIGNQIGVAIENARLHERVQDLAVTEERGRIAREMHDGVAQVLGYVNAKTLAAKTLLDTGKVGQAQEQLSQLEAAAKETYVDVREAILGLRSMISRGERFIPALEEYLQNFYRMSGIQVAFSVTPEDASFHFHPQVEIQLIRIIQEALSNVRKHSGAEQAWIGLEANDGQMKMVIRDNGRGFDPLLVSRRAWPRFGLQTMRERAETIGGKLEIKSRPGAGTELLVSIPKSVERQETNAYLAR